MASKSGFPSEVLVTNPMTHALNCPGSRWDGDCTCGLAWRELLETERSLKGAWEKRAMEAEAELRGLRAALENAISDLDTAVERECWEDVGTVIAYMREALAKSPDEPRAESHYCIDCLDAHDPRTCGTLDKS